MLRLLDVVFKRVYLAIRIRSKRNG